MTSRALAALAILCSSVYAISTGWTVAAQGRRPLDPSDIFELKTIGDPRISPDGAWVAYTVSSLDKKEDALKAERQPPGKKEAAGERASEPVRISTRAKARVLRDALGVDLVAVEELAEE